MTDPAGPHPEQEASQVSWYVIREIPKPPYELTVSGHSTEHEAYAACPDDLDFQVWPHPAQQDCELGSQGGS